MRQYLLFILFLFNAFSGWATYNPMEEQQNLMRDLCIVEYWNQRLNTHFPVTYNNFLQGGYINMPSARMGHEGELAAGYSSVPPYRSYNLRCQFLNRLEITGNYRVFIGVDDPILSPLGFGDLSDKGANFKISLFSPEDSYYALPGVSIGMDDFIGTRSFKASYIVATKVFLDYDTDVTLGYGIQRIRGFFGGVSWFPFRRSNYSYLEGISLTAEYDATPYKDATVELHPDGRIKKTPINLGVKYRLWDTIDLSASWIRGDAFACSASVFYNFGLTKGILPKIKDPLPYKSPVNTEPIGILRPEDALVQDFLFAFEEQGFDLLKMTITYQENGKKALRVNVMNYYYRLERTVQERFDYLIAYLTPSNIDIVILVVEGEGFPVQEYRYNMDFVRDFAAKQMGPYELRTLTPVCEVTVPRKEDTLLLFKRNREWYEIDIVPRTHTLFGSAKGKLKYALGLGLAVDGFMFNDLYYSVRVGYNFLTNMGSISGTDRLNPSQLPNVRTDVILYYKHKGLQLDEGYVQKNWNMGRGWFSRVSLGYFEQEYAGLGGELLYYPVNSCWAIGLESALFKKRTIGGLGFTNKVRQLNGFVPYYHKFNFNQYFLTLYHEWKEAKIDTKISGGKFLADDYGVRFELERYFPSGLRLGLWYTVTNGHDHINGHTYYDKGVFFSMPIDIFYTRSARARWGYGMSAWLRDVGVQINTGDSLYDLIREQRLD